VFREARLWGADREELAGGIILKKGRVRGKKKERSAGRVPTKATP